MVKFPINNKGNQVCTSCGREALYNDSVKRFFNQHRITGLCGHCLDKLNNREQVFIKLENNLFKISMSPDGWINPLWACTSRTNYEWVACDITQL